MARPTNKFKDLTGQKFNKLTAIKHIGGRYSKWLFVCDCGKETITSSQAVRTGNTKSCGCIMKHSRVNKHLITHGWQVGNFKEKKYIRFYGIFKGVRQRCNDKNYTAYKRYGGRGIKCYWDKFEEFANDMHDSYLKHVEEFGEKETTLDRIDNNKGYFKENCRWATHKEQQNNTSKNVVLNINGERISLYDYCNKNNLKKGTFYSRLQQRGGDVDEVINFIPKSNINVRHISKEFIFENLDKFYTVIDGGLRDIAFSRTGYLTGAEESLEAIGKRLGITRERVRQLEKKSIEIINRC